MTAQLLSRSNDIGGPGGLPLLGSTLQFLAGPRAFAERLHDRYGAVSRVNYFGKEVFFLLGADANEAVLMDREQAFSSSGGWAYIAQWFHGGLMLRDFADHRDHRRLLQTAFREAALRRYAESISRTVATVLPSWPDTAPEGVYWKLKRLMMRVALTTLLGDDTEGGEELGKHFLATLEATYGLMPGFVPGSAKRRGSTSRLWLERYVDGLIERKLRSPDGDPGVDLLGQLVGQMNEDGGALSRAVIIDHVIFLMMAAHDTTTSALTAVIASLCDHQPWQERVRGELADLDLEAPALERLAASPQTEAVLNEAMRLHAPLGAIPRFTVKPVSVSGVDLPAGCHVIVSPDFVHRCAEYWPSPQRFDPDRFLDPAAVSARHRFAWVPFGGGAHKCLGMHVAYLQVKLLLAHLLRRWRVSAGSSDTRPWIHLPMPRPRDGLPIHLETLR